MLKSIAIIAVILAIAIAVVLILAATKPDTLRVQRSDSIKAPPEKIFPLINDFHQWRSWSPYENKDPAMKRTYERRGAAARARSMPGTATRMSVPAAWKFSKPPRRERSSSSSISSRRSRATTPPSSQCCRRAMAPMSHG